MKARKILTAAAILALVLGASTPIMAANKTLTPTTPSDTTNVTADVTEAYTVTIPETIAFANPLITSGTNWTTQTVNDAVSASNVLIPSDKLLQVSVGDPEDLYVRSNNNEDTDVNFTVTVNGSTTPLDESNAVVLTKTAGEPGTTVSASLTLTQSTLAQYSGDYKGTMTFVCKLVDTTSAGA